MHTIIMCEVCSSFICYSSGGVELLVFSEFYQIELIVVDIQTLRLDRFGKIYYFSFL